MWCKALTAALFSVCGFGTSGRCLTSTNTKKHLAVTKKTQSRVTVITEANSSLVTAKPPVIGAQISLLSKNQIPHTHLQSFLTIPSGHCDSRLQSSLTKDPLHYSRKSEAQSTALHIKTSCFPVLSHLETPRPRYLVPSPSSKKSVLPSLGWLSRLHRA